jgi:prevent-host-death family protein
MSSSRQAVSLTDAKQRLGELVKRAAYGGETVVLEFRGKPVAAIVSYAEIEGMEKQESKAEYARELVADLRALRDRGAEYRTKSDFDSAEEIRKLRAGEAHEFPGLPGQ